MVVLVRMTPSTLCRSRQARIAARSLSCMSGASLTKIGRRGFCAAARRFPLAHQPGQQRIEPVRRLQIAQTGRIRRGDVDGEIIGDAVKGHKPRSEILDRIGAILVRSDIDADDPAGRFASRALAASWPPLLKPSRLIAPRSRISRNTRGRGLPGCGRGVTVPISVKPKPMASSAPGTRAILVEAGRHADRIGKIAARRRLAQPCGRRRRRADKRPASSARSVSSWARSGSRNSRPDCAMLMMPPIKAAPLRAGCAGRLSPSSQGLAQSADADRQLRHKDAGKGRRPAPAPISARGPSALGDR